MKSAVVCLFALLASLAVFPGVLASRNLQQSAQAAATGSQAAAATAQAQNVGGQQQASTGAAALGQGSTTLGVSVAAGEVDVCLNGPNENFSICRTRAPSVRSSVCTDVPPDDRFNCTQQAVDFKKCTQPFMFVGSFCLKSCTRCGEFFFPPFFLLVAKIYY